MPDAALRAEGRVLMDPAERASYLARFARTATPADLLRERVRVGDVANTRVELAARLGHAVALELAPSTAQVDWTSWSQRRDFLLPLVGSDRRLVVSWLTDGAERALEHAERVLPTFEARTPGDSRPRMAIKAGRDLCAVMRRWVRGEATADEVREAQRAAAPAAAAAAYAAYDATAAAYAATAGAYVATAGATAATAGATAAYADARRREARGAEHAWRRDRLAAHLLGEAK